MPDPPPRSLPDRAAAYVAEQKTTDRQARLAQRFAAVGAHRSRWQRRRRLAVGAVVLVLVGAGWWWQGWIGAAAGVLVVLGVWGGLALSQLVLERTRGASGWSWQTQRYVAIGTPAKEVQQLDEPDRGKKTAGGREAPPKPTHHRPDR